MELLDWKGSVWILEQLDNIDPEKPSSNIINAIARYSIKNAEYCKYVVNTIENFLSRTQADKYIVVLYVIDSIVQHSKSRSMQNDRYPSRFAINLAQTINLILQQKSKFV
ncbi:protein scaf8 [Anaeramoeba flamelloides]|uniref:Protein scaf8 n=1 Tax=Anaeramoeba flamelloides TaxID=1746091 RepID=A0ABQ8YQ13_9EUKA|nr:protein scaf8 [Anaeramoeba flamelloides]